MAEAEHYLVAGRVTSALIPILHFILAFKPELYSTIVPGQGSPLTEMAEQGSSALIKGLLI